MCSWRSTWSSASGGTAPSSWPLALTTGAEATLCLSAQLATCSWSVSGRTLGGDGFIRSARRKVLSDRSKSHIRMLPTSRRPPSTT